MAESSAQSLTRLKSGCWLAVSLYSSAVKEMCDAKTPLVVSPKISIMLKIIILTISKITSYDKQKQICHFQVSFIKYQVVSCLCQCVIFCFIAAATGDMPTYQIPAPTTALPQGVVMAASPGGLHSPQQLAEEATRKRELRLMKNR